MSKPLLQLPVVCAQFLAPNLLQLFPVTQGFLIQNSCPLKLFAKLYLSIFLGPKAFIRFSRRLDTHRHTRLRATHPIQTDSFSISTPGSLVQALIMGILVHCNHLLTGLFASSLIFLQSDFHEPSRSPSSISALTAFLGFALFPGKVLSVQPSLQGLSNCGR